MSISLLTMLEPALLLVAEAISSGPDLRTFLGGGGLIAASAMMYRHRTSPGDHDWKFNQNTRFIKNSLASHGPKATGFQNQKSVFKYGIGYCFQFQQTGSCETTECRYLHKCSKCQEPTHGQDSCQKN